MTTPAEPIPSPLLTELLPTSPVPIASIDALRADGIFLVRARSTDGAEGVAVATDALAYLHPILTQIVAPQFVGRDARDLPALVDGIARHGRFYKLAGLAAWSCVAWVEFAILDLLGKLANRPVHELLGGPLRRDVPVYLSSMRRDTTPEEEVARVAARLSQTGARAVKVKVGGRMSRNADASPGRSQALVRLLRRELGDDVTIGADANGSYDADHAIDLGRFLQDHGVAFFEEPCPFEEYDETKRVADALDMIVSGGEQDASLARFRWMIANRGVDLLQPDVTYNGGLLRTLEVARLAAAAGINVTPHNSRSSVHAIYMLHFAACCPNLGPFQEFNIDPPKPMSDVGPTLQVRDGKLAVPAGAGLGITIDSALLRDADVMQVGAFVHAAAAATKPPNR
jgi:L-alanine-DL-glutamate epimerase-like enolase superfamily enzyme